MNTDEKRKQAGQREMAPDGQEWVCAACGRHGKDRYRMGDTSCYTHAHLAYSDSLIIVNGRLIGCKWVEHSGPVD